VTAEEKHQVICNHCKFKFAYRNRVACPRCKTPIEKMVNPKFLNYTYYHCSRSGRPVCSQKYLSGPELEKQINENLARICISQQFKDWAIKYLHELHEKEATSQIEVTQSQQKAYQECVQEIDNLVKLKTSPGNADGSRLSDEEYGRRRVELLKMKKQLEELLNGTGYRTEQRLKLSEQTFEFACAVQERFAKGDPKTKKAILTTMGSNLTLKDKKLLIEARKPFFILGNMLSPEEPLISPFEPEKPKAEYGQIIPSLFLSPYVRGVGDDVRTLKHKSKKLAKQIYRFFGNVCKSPDFNLADWWLLYYFGNIDDGKNGTKTG
jgi:hypothetical protein